MQIVAVMVHFEAACTERLVFYFCCESKDIDVIRGAGSFCVIQPISKDVGYKSSQKVTM